MKFNSLLFMLAAGLTGVAITSCGGSNGNSQAPALTPQATIESTPAGSTIASGSTVAVGCSSGSCSLYVPTGSGFQSFNAPAGITSANQISSVGFQNGSLLVVSNINTGYVSTNLTNNQLLSETQYAQVIFTLTSSLYAVLKGGSQYGIASGVSYQNGLFGGNIASSTESPIAMYPTPSMASACSSGNSVATSAIAGTGSNVAGNAYVGLGLSNGQVCVFNTNQSAFSFTNLTNYPKAKSAYTSTAPVGGIAFYQKGTSCSGYWFNADATIWGVNATCGASTVNPLTFTPLASSNYVSGAIPQNPSAIYVDQTNGLWVGGSIAGFAVIYYLTPGSNQWTFTPVLNASNEGVAGTVTAISGEINSNSSTVSSAVATVVSGSTSTSYSLTTTAQ